MPGTYLVTGGAGFIGSALVRHIIGTTDAHVVCLDALTYAGREENLQPVVGSGRLRFVWGDIRDGRLVTRLLEEHRPDAVLHLAAESHVDRSIDGPRAFVETNVLGTFTLLEAVRDARDKGRAPRFVHVSTDEVYGSLGAAGTFTERTPYDPSSPYSASKAAADHLVRAWCRTFGLDAVLTNCSNNYGPYQFPEKLVPTILLSALDGQPLPVYGDGSNVRDWLYVDDHVRALMAVLERGRGGETYLVGGRSERTNLEVVNALTGILDELRPRADGRSYAEQIAFVADRPGHDHRYAIDPSKLERETGWTPSVTFEEGLRRTVAWYLEHEGWWRPLREGGDGAGRLGLGR